MTYIISSASLARLAILLIDLQHDAEINLEDQIVVQELLAVLDDNGYPRERLELLRQR